MVGSGHIACLASQVNGGKLNGGAVTKRLRAGNPFVPFRRSVSNDVSAFEAVVPRNLGGQQGVIESFECGLDGVVTDIGVVSPNLVNYGLRFDLLLGPQHFEKAIRLRR